MNGISLAEFAGLRRQMTPAHVAGLVARIEHSYRATLGVVEWPDDDIVWALYNPEGQTAAEHAALKVIRMCIAFRDASDDARDGWLDMIGIALADADPAHVDGLIAKAKLRKGGAKTAAARKRERETSEDEIRKAATRILKDEPRIKIAALAAMLSDRGHGGRSALEKKLPSLLGRKKSPDRR